MDLKCQKRFRDIKPKEASASGRIICSQYKSVVEYESALERDLIHLMEFSDEVFRYIEQPLQVPYTDQFGKTRNYIPDFYLEFLDKKRLPELIEVKYQIDLKEKAEELKYKFDAIRQFCENNNMIFRILTELEIRENMVYLDNLKFLGGYRNALDVYEKYNTLLLDTTHYGALIDHIERFGPIVIKDALKSYSKDPIVRAQALFWVWSMISRRTLFSDLNVKLSLNSLIWKK